MIVARICEPGGGKPLVSTGGIQIHPYDGPADGWFPVTSFNFGFVEKQQGANAPGGTGAASSTTGKAGATARAPAAAPGAQGSKPQDFAELSISKPVDTASTSLMFLAMKERMHKKGTGKEQETKLEADIHVISTVSLGKDLGNDRSSYTNLMVHLEAVNVQSWDINASGDERPTETVKLRYDRAAMLYVATGDGKVFAPSKAQGWDQTANEPFQWNLGKMQKYLPT